MTTFNFMLKECVLVGLLENTSLNPSCHGSNCTTRMTLLRFPNPIAGLYLHLHLHSTHRYDLTKDSQNQPRPPDPGPPAQLLNALFNSHCT